MSTASQSIYVAHEASFQKELGYSLSKEEAIEIAKIRYQQVLEKRPVARDHVVVRKLPLGKPLSYEDKWNAQIVWEPEPESSA